MTCWRFRLRRMFVAYLEGQVAPSEARRVEDHLLDCASCRALLLQLRAAHQMAKGLRDFPPASGPPGFDPLLACVETPPVASQWLRLWWETSLDRLATPRVVEVLALVIIVQLGLLAFSNRSVLLGAGHTFTVKPASLNLSEFRRLSISDLKTNTQPHVSTDGYVREVHADHEEGTVQFKLVQDPQDSGPFVVCEIIGDQTPIPRAGSHVRVYGVARYDGQTDRQWYEVNPVLSIIPTNR